MADLEEIMSTLAAFVAGTIYPNGTGAGEPNLVGVCTKIAPGWPAAQALEQDLIAGKVNVTIYPMGSDKNVTRHAREWREIARATKTLTVTVVGNTLTFGGTVSVPCNVGVRVAPTVGDGDTIVYAVQEGDTLATIATAVAGLISAIVPASSSGAVVTVTGGGVLQAKIGVTGTQMRELKRQVQDFAITIWAPTPTLRKTTAKVIDAALASLDYITLIDTQAARLHYTRTTLSDEMQQARVFRRDLVYSVEYATTETGGATEIVFIEAEVEGSAFETLPGPDLEASNVGSVITTFLPTASSAYWQASP